MAVNSAPRSLLVMSGGLDSTVLAHKLRADGRTIRGIYIDIGYLPRIPERNSVKSVAFNLDIPLEIVNLEGIFSMVTGFVPIELLGQGELDKGQPQPFKTRTPRAIDDHVVGFHVLLSVASYYAMLAKIDTVETAIIKEQIDYNGGLANFLSQWSAIVNLLNPSRHLKLESPFSAMSKGQVIDLGRELGVDLKNTWSCYSAGPLHCGRCEGCLGRKEGFSESSVPDPTAYA